MVAVGAAVGGPWILAAFTIDPIAIPMQYLFIVVAGLQVQILAFLLELYLESLVNIAVFQTRLSCPVYYQYSVLLHITFSGTPAVP